MAETGVCKCGFKGRAAAAGYGRLLLAAAMVAAAMAAARNLFPVGSETGVTVALVAVLALSVAADIAAMWANARLEHCTGRPHRMATGVLPWLFLLILFASVPALFAANQPVLAVIVVIYLLGRIVIEGTNAGFRQGMFVNDDPETVDPEITRRCMRAAMRYAAFALVAVLAATTWLATGAAPGWAESTIETVLWVVILALLFGEAALIWSDMVADYLPAEPDKSGPSFLDEPRSGLKDIPLIAVDWAGWWLANGGILLLVYELCLAGQTALAALFVPLTIMARAANTERKLRVPEDRRGEISRPSLMVHAAVRDIARTLHFAVATPVRAARRLLRRNA